MRQEYPTEEIPNTQTISSMAELESGGGTLFTGSTEAYRKQSWYPLC